MIFKRYNIGLPAQTLSIEMYWRDRDSNPKILQHFHIVFLPRYRQQLKIEVGNQSYLHYAPFIGKKQSVCIISIMSLQLDSIEDELNRINDTLNNFDIDDEVDTILDTINDIPDLVDQNSQDARDGALHL